MSHQIGSSRPASSQLTDRTLDVLQAFAALGSASLPQIEAYCRLPTTTAHRIMQSLLRRGFLMRTGRGDYRLGSAVADLAAGVSHRDLLPLAARPYLQALSKKTRSHAHLGVWEEGMVTYLLKQRYGKTRLHSAEGAQLEAYCSALGKVLLSELRDDELDSYLFDGSLVALTPNTITDPQRLRHEIDEVRARGWACDNEEIASGLRCIAVPLRTRDGRGLAAVSVSAISTRRQPTDPQNFLPWLIETAQLISCQLFPQP